ncbi:prostatic acid phosphatase-like isoform X2 [Daktulosphaira vitifoliae]|uniref:prostatic acid phosphatase-like isoform X2 n=1 Tax=Daktulosphaira vitifoliae TaxID=58002 RepID=UPI0021AA485F|nr:prostatic acid phosphatase-like isoform X2 [Daktulosphaira vitifoliae]
MQKIILVLFPLFYGELCMSIDPLADKYGELIFASIIYRHGDRSINHESYPTDPYRNASYWSVGYGQLTNKGKERHYLLGKWLRNRYSDLLPAIYSLDDIYIHSTNIDRALMSAGANLAGLYPPQKDQIWNGEIGHVWQPIPIHSLSPMEDKILTFGDNCPRYIEEFHKLMNSSEIQNYHKNHTELYNYVKEHSGLEMKNPIYDLQFLYDVLLVETEYNYTLPNWTESVYPDKLQEVAELSFKLQTYTPLLKKLNYGMLIKEIVNHMELKSNNTLIPDRKLWVYSAHDTIIAGILNTLNVYDGKLPAYASTVLFELRKMKNSKTFVVTVSYKNSSNHEPYLLQIPGCDSVACELSQFSKAVSPYTSINWYKECHNNIIDNTHLLYYGGMVVIFLILISILIYIINKKYIFCYCGRDYQKF